MSIRLAEHHIIRAALAGDHRIVPRGEVADADDAVRFQRGQRLLHRLDAGEMRAVGAAARDQIGVTIEQQRRAAVLDRGRQSLDPRNHGARIGGLQPQQHCGDIAAGQQAGQASIKPGSSTSGVAR